MSSDRISPKAMSSKRERERSRLTEMAGKKIVGNPTPRVEGEAKVGGEAIYAVDVVLPDMLWVRVLRSPISYGRIRRLDARRATSALAH